MVSNIVIILYGERWLLDLGGDHFIIYEMSNHYIVHLKIT